MSLSEILGHNDQINQLKRAYESKRLGHALIFSGPDGVGKKKTAVEFAKALNCEKFGGASDDGGGLFGEDDTSDGPNWESCGQCTSCTNFEARTALNLVELSEDEDAKVIKIESIRNLLKEIRYTVESGLRFIIIDDAERFHAESANAFLKTLEEPPKNTHIVIITSSVGDLLPTVISRCQRINFKPLKTETVEELLLSGKCFDESDRDEILEDRLLIKTASNFAQGSLSRAVSICSGGFDDNFKKSIDAITNILDLERSKLLDLSEKLSKSPNFFEFMDCMKDVIRESLFVAIGQKTYGSEILENYLVASKEFKSKLGHSDFKDVLTGWYDQVERARRDVSPPFYANKQATLDNMFLQMAKLAS